MRALAGDPEKAWNILQYTLWNGLSALHMVFNVSASFLQELEHMKKRYFFPKFTFTESLIFAMARIMWLWVTSKFQQVSLS